MSEEVLEEPKLDILKETMLKNIEKIEFRDFFAKASKCSDNNARILLIVKQETYDIIAQTPFLNKEYFHYLVETLKDKIYNNLDLVVKMPKSEKLEEEDLDNITLGEELDIEDLDDIKDLEDLDLFENDDEMKNLTFLLTKKIKVLLVLENKDDYLCIRKWAMTKVKNMKEKINILAADRNGIVELLEEDFHDVIQKSMEQKKSVVNTGMDTSSEDFKKFSKVIDELIKNISPNDSEINSFIDFMLADEEMFLRNGKFNLKSFALIPSFITKNFGSLTQRIKENIDNKNSVLIDQIETIKEVIGGLDNDKDLSFFILNEIIKDVSLVIIKKLYLNYSEVQEYINESLSQFNDIMSIITNPTDAQTTDLKLALKDMVIPHLNDGWNEITSEEEQ